MRDNKKLAAKHYQSLVDAYNEVNVQELSDDLLRRFRDLMEEGWLDSNREMYERNIK